MEHQSRRRIRHSSDETHPVKFIYADNPSDIDYSKHNINNAILIDNTGVYRDESGLSRHLVSKGSLNFAYSAQRALKKYSLWGESQRYP